MSGLRAALSVFDDAALEALANKGLVRRAAKDVEAGKVTVTSLSETAAVVAADDGTVEVDARGPRAARCTCVAKEICRHRLAAVMVLRAGGDAAAPASSGRTGEAAASAPGAAGGEPGLLASTAASPGALAPVQEDVLAEALSIEPAVIAKWAGKAGFRAALEIAEQAAAPEFSQEGRALVVRLSNDEPEVRILAGQGLGGILSKGPAARQKALHAAAVLALRRTHGLPIATPESSLPAEAPAEAGAIESDGASHAAVRRALEDAARTALNQAPLVLEDRLFELSVSSRVGHLPRLGGALRELAGQLREKRAGSFTLTPEDLLERLARAYALNDALDRAGSGDTLAALAGEARQDYVPCGPLNS